MSIPASLTNHRVESGDVSGVCEGEVRVSPVKLVWFFGMLAGAVVGGVASFSLAAFALFAVTTALVLLLGHSLGNHRRLIHNSYACPQWLEYFLVYCGVHVGLDGPLGLMRQHELRDYAQRLPVCHDYLRHGRSFWVDGWWQLVCSLRLRDPPEIRIEERVARDRFYVFLQRTWMAQQLPLVLVFYAWGGWGFVFWGVCARVVVGVAGHWLIGYFAHNHGGKHYVVQNAAVQGHNIRWTSLLTMGECWHNNHHAFPGSAKLGLRPGEWDPGWWTLLALQRCGLVWDLQLPADLPPRPELVELPDAPRAIGLPATMKLAFASRPLTMRWPAAKLSPRQMHRLVGATVALEVQPQAKRLTVYSDIGPVHGLPGLCVALARRAFAARMLACLALPIAITFERLRTALEGAECRV